MNHFELFNKNHQDALESIHNLLSSVKDYDAEFVHLAWWLLETGINPYSILPENWANCMETSTGFDSLLHHIHHAMVDDGDICFPVYHGEPAIRFDNKHDLTEKTVKNYISEIRLSFTTASTAVTDITFLNSAYEFTVAADAHDAKMTRRYFLSDAEMFGVEFAVKHHSTKSGFNPAWIDLVDKE